MTQWSAPVSDDEAYRRAGGRRRYNAWRRDMATLRRWQCAELMVQGYDTVEIAAALGVSPRTVRRYRRQLLAEAAQTGTCPICGARVIMGGRGVKSLAPSPP